MVLRFIFLTLSVSRLAHQSCNAFEIRSPRASRITQLKAAQLQSPEGGPDDVREGSLDAATKELGFVPYGELVSCAGNPLLLFIQPRNSLFGTGPTISNRAASIGGLCSSMTTGPSIELSLPR